jgi:Xaa-Pro aminopeptidase
MDPKHARINQLLDRNGLDALIIQKISNFAWVTGGAASYINTAATNGVGKLLITRNTRHLIADNIEIPRFEIEEGLADLGWEFHVQPWYLPQEILGKLTRGLKLGADGFYPGAVDLASELSIMRSYLDENEQNQFRSLASLCAEAMDDAVSVIKPGLTEYQIAGLLAGESLKRGVLPIVNLIATDERIYNFRHPLPTSKRLDKYAMLVLCGRQKGLVCSLTRLIHFGALSAELKEKANAVAYIDAVMIDATRPGKSVMDVFQIAQNAYAEVGFETEWQLHHQGGPAGYDPREFLATGSSTVPVGVGQAYAWNPSITGCKSEDTILVGESENDILTVLKDWPLVSVDIGDSVIERPAIKVID